MFPFLTDCSPLKISIKQSEKNQFAFSKLTANTPIHSLQALVENLGALLVVGENVGRSQSFFPALPPHRLYRQAPSGLWARWPTPWCIRRRCGRSAKAAAPANSGSAWKNLECCLQKRPQAVELIATFTKHQFFPVGSVQDKLVLLGLRATNGLRRDWQIRKKGTKVRHKKRRNLATHSEHTTFENFGHFQRRQLLWNVRDGRLAVS